MRTMFEVACDEVDREIEMADVAERREGRRKVAEWALAGSGVEVIIGAVSF
jgi:hypothetical protein